MSNAREHRDPSVAHATEPSWMSQSSPKSRVSAAGACQQRFPHQVDATRSASVEVGLPRSCHDRRHFVHSSESIWGERHESAIGIVMNDKDPHTRPPQAVSRGRPCMRLTWANREQHDPNFDKTLCERRDIVHPGGSSRSSAELEPIGRYQVCNAPHDAFMTLPLHTSSREDEVAGHLIGRRASTAHSSEKGYYRCLSG